MTFYASFPDDSIFSLTATLPEEADEQFASCPDVYPWEYTPFPLDGDVILIRDDRLADALKAMPQDGRNILLMYWFLEMADREIGEKLSLPANRQQPQAAGLCHAERADGR